MPKSSIEDMSQYEQARWLSLIEAVNVIYQGCIDNNKNFDEVRLEPLPIRKYIEKTCDSKAELLQREEDEAKRDKAYLLMNQHQHRHINELELV